MTNKSSYNVNDVEELEGLKFLLNVDPQGKKLLTWAQEHHEEIENIVRLNGAVLIRGLKILSSKQFGTLLSTLFGDELIQYTYRSTPRTELRGNVYTATEYHPDQVIPQHNENAYSNKWAMRIGFVCTVPSETGGSRPVCDSRVIYNRLPKELIEKFDQKKIMYVRNYSDIDLPWSEVFQTEDRSIVEAYCRDNNMQFEWLDNNALRTRQINPASAIHPYTKEKLWFNQAHLFHVSNLEPEVRDSLLDIMHEDQLPRNTYYGDGSPIEPEYLELIRNLYEEEKIIFEWQKNDVMLLDNMLFSHGRTSFSGHRQVLVGMARPNSSSVETTQKTINEDELEPA